MKLKYHQVDAFTSTVFGGNYAGVIITTKPLGAKVMQRIATENNVSETAFVVVNEDATCDIRWFSPLQEIDFCGHATLAAAFVLFERDVMARELRFYAKAVGDIVVTQDTDGRINMTFPVRPLTPLTHCDHDLTAILGAKPKAIYQNPQAIVCEFETAAEVKALAPDTAGVAQLLPLNLCATAAADDYDFVSRYFWPDGTGGEDPVTGSMHAGLAPFWAERLQKNDLRALQASARGGELFCKVQGDEVVVSGYAVKYLEGKIFV